MFEDDGMMFVREVEPDRKVRGRYERKRIRVGPRSLARSLDRQKGYRRPPH